jgi:hypothetical protein
VLTIGKDSKVERPWGQGMHAGPFFGWGDLFVGYLVDSKRRLVAGVHTAIVPGVF